MHFEWITPKADLNGDAAFIHTDFTNNKPGDLLFVTPNPYRGATCPCIAIAQLPPIGVRYDRGNGQWSVVTEDGSAMPSGESFNVLAEPRSGPAVFVQQATKKNSAGNHTFIDSSATNGKPDAVLEVTQLVNPGGNASSHYNAHPIGVRYYSSKHEWAVINEDGAPMRAGAAFNVLVGASASSGGITRTVIATAANTKGDGVQFSSPASNGRSGSMSFVTPVWNPDGKGGTKSVAQTGVAYDAQVSHRWDVIDDLLSSVPLGSAYNVLIYPLAQHLVRNFESTAGSGSTTGDAAHLDSVLTNSEPSDVLFVTPNPYRGAKCPCIAVAPLPAIGVWYDRINDQWAVVTEDQSEMPSGESFNVLAEPVKGGAILVQTAQHSNTAGDHTFLNSPLTNGKPNAVLEVTQVANPGGTNKAVFNPHPIGVRYYPVQRRWAVFNEGGAAMTPGASFNILVGTSASGGGVTKVLTATKANEEHNAVFFSSSESNGHPHSVSFVTPVWNPGGKGGVRSVTQTGVGYDTPTTQWAMVGYQLTKVPLGSAYNLLIYRS